ncbi:hypothetical protein BDV33DRAFT_149870 [Aspergillus novoparasiticus]|uniref:Uncharacterized protein n=1 Tax=Aspergillus novoparasiticus TaxID=986946 RepID=A0A5N6EHQ6_9EURO|nr:hypothetical protein BDV33DRAFT_149870 [Aspergillus novoparasiticus]
MTVYCSSTISHRSATTEKREYTWSILVQVLFSSSLRTLFGLVTVSFVLSLIINSRFTGSWHLVAGLFVNMGPSLTKHLQKKKRMSADCFNSFLLNGSFSLFLFSSLRQRTLVRRDCGPQL